jgi:hypothetical protein
MRDLVATPLPEALDPLSDMIGSAPFRHPPVPSSGLDPMQAGFARLRRWTVWFARRRRCMQRREEPICPCPSRAGIATT